MNITKAEQTRTQAVWPESIYGSTAGCAKTADAVRNRTAITDRILLDIEDLLKITLRQARVKT
jgi:4'-phosphopantetheinyl transferase EntD